MKTELERAGISVVVVATLGIIATDALNVILSAFVPRLSWPAAMDLSYVAVCAAASLLLWRRVPTLTASAAAAFGTGAAGTLLLGALRGFDHIAFAPLVLAPAMGLAGAMLRRRLPASLDGAFRRRRTVAILWAVLGVVTVVQSARLSTYMADASYNWWLTTSDPFWSRHECMTAYVYGAELNRDGAENVYNADHYPGVRRDAVAPTNVAHLQPEDPYQYPPQFLLLPRLTLALSNDYYHIRALWFALQAVVFLTVAFLLARWLGGNAGVTAALLIPLVWISVPAMLNFQYGQFHLTTIAIAVAAFLAFESGRNVAGGALLAMSILSKGFAGIVLIPLLLARRWRPLLWTAAFAIGITGVALLVLGPEPFSAFVHYHLPRLRSGEAFAFERAWPEVRTMLFAGNVSPFSVVQKLGDLGVPGMTDGLARVVHGVFSVVVLVVAAFASRLRARSARAFAWLALLNLAAMTSPAAWGDYVPVGSVWLLTLMASSVLRNRRDRWLVAACWGFCFFLPGVVPIVTNLPAPAAFSLSIACTVILLVLNGRVASRGVLAWELPAVLRTGGARAVPNCHGGHR